MPVSVILYSYPSLSISHLQVGRLVYRYERDVWSAHLQVGERDVDQIVLHRVEQRGHAEPEQLARLAQRIVTQPGERRGRAAQAEGVRTAELERDRHEQLDDLGEQHGDGRRWTRRVQPLLRVPRERDGGAVLGEQHRERDDGRQAEAAHGLKPR